MIEVTGLGRRFGVVEALRNLSFAAAPGEIVGFLGPNGAGKTTVMRILTCTLPPTAGRATVAGHDIATAALAVRRRIGFMPENVPLYTDCTVDELLRLVARLKEVPARTMAAAVDGVVRRAGLLEVRSRLVGHLSKGFRQRVGVAQALLGDPPVLILDEPSSGLDPQQIVEIRELIRGFAGEKTVLLSSHILNEVSLICGRVLILDRGQLVGEADPRVLAPRLDGRLRVAVAWDGPREAVSAALAAVRGVIAVVPVDSGVEVTLDRDPETVRPDLAAAVIGAGGRLQRMEDRGTTLEELFLRLTAGRCAPGAAPPTAPPADNGREAAP